MWSDYRSAWNVSDFPKFPSLHVSPTKIWTPDVYLTNEYVKQYDVFGVQLCTVSAAVGRVNGSPNARYRLLNATHCIRQNT